jgi:PAS domain S-box-containing protein
MLLGKWIRFSFASLFIVQVCLILATIYSALLFNRHENLISNTLKTIATAEDLKSSLLAIDDAQRGFALTGLSEFLQKYFDTTAKIPRLLSILILNGNIQALDLREIESFIRNQIAFSEMVFKTRTEKGINAALNLIVNSQINGKLNTVDNIIDNLIENKKMGLKSRVLQDKLKSRIAGIFVLFGGLFALFLATFTSRKLTRVLVNPLNQLLDTIHRMQLGERLEIPKLKNFEGATEINRLSNTLYQIADARQRSEQELVTTSNFLKSIFHACPVPIARFDKNLKIATWNRAAEQLFGWTESEIIGQSPPNVPDERIEELEGLFAAAKMGQSTVNRETERRNRIGKIIPVNISLAPILNGGDFQGAIVVIEDISERRRQEDQKTTFLESQRALDQMFEATAYASVVISDQAIAHSHDIQHVLRTIAEQSRLITRASFAAIGVGTKSDQSFDPWVACDEKGAAALNVPSANGVLGWVARHGQSVRLLDLKSNPAFHGFSLGNDLEVEAFLGVPIRYEGRSVGNLYLAKKPGEPPFTQEDQRAIELLAAHCGIVIQNSSLYETVSLERRRLHG